MDQLDYIEIGKRIKLKRNEMHLTQEKLSEIIDVSPSYISEMERGASICSLATISNISSVLQTSLDYLVFGITENNSNQTFTEVLKSVPEKNHKLFIDLCESISNSLK